MVEPSPDDDAIVVDADRILALRTFLGMEDLAIAEAVQLLGMMTERRWPAGSVLATRGAPLPAAWFVLEGELRLGGAPERRARAHEIAGILELLGDTPDGLDVVTATEVVALEVGRDDLFAQLALDFEMVRGVIQTLSANLIKVAPDVDRTEPLVVPPASGQPLDFATRLRFARGLGSFPPSAIATLADVATAFEETTAEGVLLPAGATVDRIWIVVEGELRAGNTRFVPGSMFGRLPAFAEAALAHDVVAAPGTRLLGLPMATVLDLYEDDATGALFAVRVLAAHLADHQDAFPLSGA